MAARRESLVRWRRGALILLIVAACSASAQPARFDIAGSGHLAIDAPAQTNARFALKAQLSAASDSAATMSVQTGTRFALTSQLSTASLVCYNDTIFRDDFDGDGF